MFESLQKQDGYIIVKCEKDYDTEYAFTIGKIIKVTTKRITMKDFNGEGEWYEDVFNIPFSVIFFQNTYKFCLCQVYTI